ncbi:MAG: hypothetical protein RL885_08695 [Planctomycetota bacterium]
MNFTSYLPLSLPFALAAVLSYPATSPVPCEKPAAAGEASAHPRIVSIVIQELDAEQRFRLMREVVRLRAEDRAVGLEVLGAALDELDVETLLREMADGVEDRQAMRPLVRAGVDWIDRVVSLEPQQRWNLERRLGDAATLAGGSFGNRLGQLGPGMVTGQSFDRETRQAFRELVSAILGEAADQQDEAQPLRRAVLEDLTTYAGAVRVILTDEQEQAIRDAARTFLTSPREDRQAQVCTLLQGVDTGALQQAIEAVRKAEPADRPKAVRAAVDVFVQGVAPTWIERFELSPLQQVALQGARDSFFASTELDRSTLSVMRDDRRQIAWSSLGAEEQTLLKDAAQSLRLRFEEWRDALCQ